MRRYDLGKSYPCEKVYMTWGRVIHVKRYDLGKLSMSMRRYGLGKLSMSMRRYGMGKSIHGKVLPGPIGEECH